jgi:hypothetical protein
MGLATIDQLVVLQVPFQALDYLDSESKVVLAVRKNQFTNMLALVGALANQSAVAAEKVFGEKFVEFTGRTRSCIDVNSGCNLFAQHQGVGEGSVNR